MEDEYSLEKFKSEDIDHKVDLLQIVPIKILFYNKIGILLLNLDLRNYPSINVHKEKSKILF